MILAAVFRVAASIVMFVVAAALYVIVCPPDAYASEPGSKTDSTTFKIIAAYLVFVAVMFAVFWAFLSAVERRDDE